MCPKLIELLSWNGPTVHVCCFMLARASTKTFVSRIRKRRKNLLWPKNSSARSLVSRGIAVFESHVLYSRSLQFFPRDFASYLFIFFCCSDLNIEAAGSPEVSHLSVTLRSISSVTTVPLKLHGIPFLSPNSRS